MKKRSTNRHEITAGRGPAVGTKRGPLAALLALAGAILTADAQAQNWDLLTVSDTNTLMRVDLDLPAFPSTALGVTEDWPGGTVRRIRGLAYAGTTLFGITREGDLVTVDDQNGQTTLIYSIGTGSSTQFWSGLTYDPAANALYTVNAFGGVADQNLVRIDLGGPSHTVQGSTTLAGGTFAFQTLGVAFMDIGGVPTLLGSNRQNSNIVELDPATGDVAFTWGGSTSGVNNPQQIAVHPGTGVLWGIHDTSQTSNNASLSTHDSTTMQATYEGELPFGILEIVGGGNDTYGWGGMAFTLMDAPSAVTQTMRSGLCDCYSPPEEPATPRTELVSFVTSLSSTPPLSNYDNTTPNNFFVESFVGLPMGCITGGTLTITVKPQIGAVNDTFFLGQTDVLWPLTSLVGDFAGWRFGDGSGGAQPVLFPGAGWTPNSRPAACGYTVSINLNTPVGGGPGTLIDQMNDRGFLDVFSEDDTSFDCMVLELELEPGCIPSCGPNPCPADLNADGILDLNDIRIVIDGFNVGCP